jgi:formylglycine-generating enzyme required for sulfatase activity
MRSLVKIEAEKQPRDTGAGIVIFASADSIRVLTAAHVVAKATSLKVYFHSDRTVAYSAHLLPGNSDPDKLDLAVLEVRPEGRALPGNIPQLAARERNTLQITEHIWTVDSGWISVPNNVTKLDHDTDTQKFEYTRGATNDGFSGGAVFDDDGRLVGIHDEGAAGGQYAVAVKLDSAVEVLAALGHNTPNLLRAGTAAPTPGTGRGNTRPVNPVASGPRAGDTRVNAKDGLTYVWIPAGSFTMGCSPGDTECTSDEKPAHAEQIANGFWLGQTEVTQAAWKRVTNSNPSSFESDRLPVENVDWTEAGDYCKAIGGRLPTEKEWEYAARAGTRGARYGALDAIAWYNGNSGDSTHPVGLKQANAYSLYDMLGNVFEWTSDNYGDGTMVVRGGSWFFRSGFSRASFRVSSVPTRRDNGIGFRCVGGLR